MPKPSWSFAQLYTGTLVVLVLVFISLRALTWAPLGHPRAFATANSTGPGGSDLIEEEPSGPGFELVISHFSSDPARVQRWTQMVRSIPKVQALGIKIIIYTKNPKTDLDQLKTVAQADEVYLLPNIGREGGTVLHHIITNYANPAQFTMFAQDEPEWSLTDDGLLLDWFHNAIANEFTPGTGFLALSSYNEPCYCGDCGTQGQFPLMVPIYNVLEKDVCHAPNFVSLWSQFIVSRSRILARDVTIYQWIFDMISAPKEHWVHDEQQPDFIKEQYMHGNSTPDNPLFGHTLERSWSMIFECSFPDSVGEAACNREKCHCLDFELDIDEDVEAESPGEAIEEADAVRDLSDATAELEEAAV